MYTAPLLASGLVFLLVWRKLLLCLERRNPAWGKHLLWIQYPTLLYLTLAYLIWNVTSFVLLDLSRLKWLDAAADEHIFEDHPYNGKKWWEDNASLLGYDGLRLFSFTAPLVAILTWAVSAKHTVEHLRHLAFIPLVNKPLADQSDEEIASQAIRDKHDRTIQIIALPLVYGVMSYMSVLRMWEVCGHATAGIVSSGANGTYLERVEVISEMYETNFMVADMYEAWALFQFASLALSVVRAKHEEHNDWGQATKDLAVGEKFVKRSTKLQKGWNELLTIQKHLEDSLGLMTVQGIYAFILTCFAQSIYYLTLGTIAYLALYPDLTKALNEGATKAAVHYGFLGAGLISSSAAIGNIVVVEQGFHDELHSFKPMAKFWATKVLVSLAFLQSMVLWLPPFRNWSVIRQNLLYASLLCFECFLVALVHQFAWGPDEGWYTGVTCSKCLGLQSKGVKECKQCSGTGKAAPVHEEEEKTPSKLETAIEGGFAGIVVGLEEPLLKA